MSAATKHRKRPAATDSISFPWHPNAAKELRRLQTLATRANQKAQRPTATPADRKAATAADRAVEKHLRSIDTVTFHLRSCGPNKYRALIAEHPPSSEQQDDFNQQLDAEGKPPQALAYNTETFPPALVAECCERIVVTGEDGWTEEDPDTDFIADLAFDGSAGWSEADQVALTITCQTLVNTATVVQQDLVAHLGND